MNLLVVTAVEAEREAVLAGLAAGSDARTSDAIPADVVAVGVGPAAAAAGTARALALAEAAGRPYRGVLATGIAGGFAGRAGIGDLVLADRCVAAGLGADSPDGFLSLDQLGFGSATLAADPALLGQVRAALPETGLRVGAILTVTTVTGTAAGTDTLLSRHPDAVAEAMEGFGAATAAAQAGLPVAELRAVSNLVGPRERGGWRITAAFNTLTAAFAALTRGR